MSTSCRLLSPAPPPPPAAVCSATQAFNGTTGRCECLPGWGGPGGCNACESDAACGAAFNASGATCSAELAFQQGMQVKAYTCDLEVRACSLARSLAARSCRLRPAAHPRNGAALLACIVRPRPARPSPCASIGARVCDTPMQCCLQGTGLETNVEAGSFFMVRGLC